MDYHAEARRRNQGEKGEEVMMGRVEKEGLFAPQRYFLQQR